MKIEVEITNLIGNNPGYNWVKHRHINVNYNSSQENIIKKVKKELGWKKSITEIVNNNIVIKAKDRGMIAFVDIG